MESAAARHRVLVTGSSGAVGRAVVRALTARGHQVRGFDQCALPSLADQRIGNISDRDAVATAVAGMDTVIHLAATPDPADFYQNLLPNNVVGLYTVFDACRQHGVKRIIFASSVQTVNGLRDKKTIIKVADGVAPRNLYAVTKVWGEVLGECWHSAHGVSVLCARLGWFMRHKDDLKEATRQNELQPENPRVYLSHRDAEDFFTRCVETPSIGYAVVFATSRDSRFDLSDAKKLLGYEPKDTFPEGMTFGPDGRSV